MKTYWVRINFKGSLFENRKVKSTDEEAAKEKVLNSIDDSEKGNVVSLRVFMVEE